MHPAQRGWGEAMLRPPVYGHGHVPGMPPVYTIAAMQPGAPHPQHHVAAAAAAVAPLQQQLLAQQAEEMRKSAKRAANRRSANTCRLRKKFFVENMADANERMRKRARVLSLLPDMILAMRRDGVITYASENCRQFLQFTRQEVEGTNIFDLVESGSHNRLRRLLEENLGSVSKEAIASALRHQGTTFESLLARAEKAKEQGDSGFFTMSGEAPRFPGPTRTGSGGSGGGGGSGAGDMGGITDDWESEAASLAGESQGRTSGASSSSGSGVGGGGSSSGGGGGGGGRKIKRWSTVGSSGSGGMSDSSSGGGGAGREEGVGGVGKGKDAGKYRRSFPPLGPPAFPVVASGERVTGGGSAAAGAGGAQLGGANGAAGGTRHAKGGGSLLPEGAKAREVGGAARKLELCSDAQGESAGGGPISGGSDGGGSGGGKASMVNVDRDLQSKINAFTNTQKDLCKLEIMRQDQKFEWYEVRSSMRLAWLKAKQMIIPVEVICSFQQMHSDCPAGSANGIVARLQRAASVARPLGAGNDGKGSGDSLSGNSSGFSGFSGFSGSGDSNGAGSPDLEDSVDLASPDLGDQGSSNGGRCGHPSSEDGHANEAVSSDYGAGTSSGSVSGDDDSAQNNSNGGAHRRAGGGGGGGGGKQPPSRKPAAAAATTGTGRARRGGGGGAAGGPEPEARGGGRSASGRTADWAGDGASPVSALAALAAAAAAASQAAPLTQQQQPSRRLAAKKSILFRHGADSQS
ncbi:unnamed protein product [Ectocarpus sp. 4 AP-2014]